MVDYMDENYTEALEEHLRQYCERQDRRRKALDTAFDDNIDYQRHGVKGVLRYIAELRTEARSNLRYLWTTKDILSEKGREERWTEIKILAEEARELADKIHQINREVA